LRQKTNYLRLAKKVCTLLEKVVRQKVIQVFFDQPSEEFLPASAEKFWFRGNPEVGK